MRWKASIWLGTALVVHLAAAETALAQGACSSYDNCLNVSPGYRVKPDPIQSETRECLSGQLTCHETFYRFLVCQTGSSPEFCPSWCTKVVGGGCQGIGTCDGVDSGLSQESSSQAQQQRVESASWRSWLRPTGIVSGYQAPGCHLSRIPADPGSPWNTASCIHTPPVGMLALGAESPAWVTFISAGGDPNQLGGALQIPFFVRGIAGDERLSITYGANVVFSQLLSGYVPGVLYTAEIPPGVLTGGSGAPWTFDLNSCDLPGEEAQVVFPLGFSGCSDGSDEDGDGLIDFPADLGCSDANDIDERSTCTDGLDNDDDGMTDHSATAGQGDPGCAGAASLTESPQCQDGLDNDNQPGIDFDGGASLDLDDNGFIDTLFNPAAPAVGAADPHCTAATLNSEGPIEEVPALSPTLLFALMAGLGVAAAIAARRAVRGS